MVITLDKVGIENSSTLINLIQLYLHDFSQFIDIDVDDSGLYRIDFLDFLLNDPSRHFYLIRVDNKLAGFALVEHIKRQMAPAENQIEEFFIIKKYRRHGIGKHVAFIIFNKFRGKWSISELLNNVPAQAFWRKVISNYTNGKYTERSDDVRIVQEFYN